MTTVTIEKDSYSSKYCQKRFEKGDKVYNRWGRYLCDKCDNDHPAPVMAVYTMGIWEQDPPVTICCGDTVTLEN